MAELESFGENAKTFSGPDVDIKNVQMDSFTEKSEKRSEIEEFCQKILDIEGFKSLLNDQNLKQVLKDRTLNSILDDLNVRQLLLDKKWKVEIEIEEKLDPDTFENNVGNDIMENGSFEHSPIKVDEIKQEVNDYLEVDFQENPLPNNHETIKMEQNHSDYVDTSMLEKSENVPKDSKEYERKFSCSSCDSTFPFKSQLQRHFLKVHLKQKPEKNLSCTKCDAMFRQKHGLKKHFLKFHCNENENENPSELPPDCLKKPPKPRKCPHCDETLLGSMMTVVDFHNEATKVL